MNYAVTSKKAIVTRQFIDLFNAANAAAKRGDAIESDRLYRECAKASPEVWLGLADKAHKENRAFEALNLMADCYEYAKNDLTRCLALNNMGLIHMRLGNLEDAKRYLQASIDIEERAPNLVNMATLTGFMEGRCKNFALLRRAISKDPRWKESYFSLALALIETGDWIKGWQEYETRFDARDADVEKPNFGFPDWDGIIRPGKSIIVCHEQGVGDCFNMLRYPILMARGGMKVWIAVPNGCRRLVYPCAPWAGVLQPGEDVPKCDYQVMLMSLPRLFRTTPTNVPLSEGYIMSPPLGDLCKPRPGVTLRIGLVWQGGLAHKQDWSRSISLDAMRPLLEMRKPKFFSLQVGPGSEQVEAFGFSDRIFRPYLNDYYDTARVISQMDLVVGVDTSVIHLAGAMGINTAVLLSTACDFRWMQGSTTTPWYDKMRLYRQQKLNDWSHPIQELKNEIAEMVNHREWQNDQQTHAHVQ